MLGYLKNEEETAKALRLHKDGRVWFHSGDSGYMDEDGFVYIQGRMNRIYITEYNSALAKIYPDRIEKILYKNSAVVECCVGCISDRLNCYKPIAFCVIADEDRSREKEIKEELLSMCKTELPEYDVPVKFVFSDSLPHTSHGKIDYKKIEEQIKLAK